MIKLKLTYDELVGFNQLFNVDERYVMAKPNGKLLRELMQEFGKKFLKKQLDRQAKYTISLKASEMLCLEYLLTHLLPIVSEQSYEKQIGRSVKNQISQAL